MGDRAFKDALYAQFARVGKTLARPARLELLDLLAQGERSVEELAREAALSLANASAHLQVLHRARSVDSRKKGLRVYYRLADPTVYRLWSALRHVGERPLAEIERPVATYLHGPTAAPAPRRGPRVYGWCPTARATGWRGPAPRGRPRSAR